MPQLDSFFFFGEGVVALVLLYTVIYFYLFWFSKQNFEYWLVNYRFSYYFEKLIVVLFYNIFFVYQASNNAILTNYSKLTVLDAWEDIFASLNAIE